jgi:hypothetical protein
MDDYTAWAVAGMPHADDHEVVRWFEVLRTAYEACQAGGDTEWEALSASIAGTAAEWSFDGTTVEQYLEALAGTGQGTQLVEHMLELADQMPGLYWQLQGGGDAAGDAFAWVTQEQRDYLQSVWGSGWPDALTEYLNGQWGEGWEQHPDEHKAAWLTDLIHTWSAQGGEDTAEAATGAATAAEAPGGAAAEAELPAPEVVAEFVDSELKAALAQIPGADELTEEEIGELRAEILEELGATAK